MKHIFVSLSLLWLCSVVFAQEKDWKNLVDLSSDSPLEFSGVAVNSESIGLYEKLEITFNLVGKWDNPFDPDQIRVDAIFYKPDKSSVTIPGFFYQEYRRDRYQRPEKTGSPVWKVRFTPELPGEYTYRVVAVNKGEEISAPAGKFSCESFDTHHGYLKVSKNNPPDRCRYRL